MVMFGEDIQKVKITREGKKGSAALVFKSGLYATLIFKNLAYGWETYVETKKGLVELKSRIPETDPIKIYSDIVDMFRTRVEPRSHQSILNEIAVLEALENHQQANNGLSNHLKDDVFISIAANVDQSGAVVILIGK